MTTQTSQPRGATITTAEYHAMQARNMTEAQLQACIIRAAGARGWLVYHTHDSRRSQPGFPDLVLVRATDQRTLFRELKTQTGRIRPEQQTWLNTLNAAGQDAAIWRPIDWYNNRLDQELA